MAGFRSLDFHSQIHTPVAARLDQSPSNTAIITNVSIGTLPSAHRSTEPTFEAVAYFDVDPYSGDRWLPQVIAGARPIREERF